MHLGRRCAGTFVATVDQPCRTLRHASMLPCVQMRCIKLSEEQAASIARMRELYLHNLGALMRRRQELSALLKVPALHAPHCTLCQPGLLTWQRSSCCHESNGGVLACRLSGGKDIAHIVVSGASTASRTAGSRT